MAKVIIEIETDNTAFDGDCFGEELARILQDFADKVLPLSGGFARAQIGVSGFTSRDTNGNTVARMSYH